MAALGVEWGAKYVLTGPDGSRAVFNDSADVDFVGILSPESSGLDSPEVRESAVEAMEEDGGVHGNFFFGRRPVVLQGTIISTSAEDRNKKVAKLKAASNALRADAVLTWQVVGSPKVELKLRLQQPLRITKGFVKDFQLPMVSANAYIEGTTEKTSTLLAAQYKNATTAENISIVGVPWANPINASTSNNVYAKASPEGTAESDELRARAFSFSIPEEIKILGVEGFIERKGTSVKDSRIKLSTTSGASEGTSQSAGAAWGSESVFVYGSPSNLWGIALTRAMIHQNTQFGLNVRVQGTVVGEGVGVGEVDNMSAAVYWREISVANPVNNEGNAPAFPVITINGPASTLILKNNTTGKEIQLTGLALAKGESITIDFKNHTIKNGSTSRYSTLVFGSSEWWYLQPGVNEVEAIATGIADTTINSVRTIVLMKYRNTYL